MTKKRRLEITLGLLIVFASSLFLPVPAFSQSGNRVWVEPPELILSLDQNGTVSVQVEATSEFYGLEIRLGYNPDLIQVQDADPNQTGVQVSAGDLFDEDQGFLVRNQADNQLGEILYAFTLLAPEPPLTGSGTLIQFEVLAIVEGSTDLELEVILASPDGIALPLDEQSGVVTIGTQPVMPTTQTPTSVSPTETATSEITSPVAPATSSPTQALTGSSTPTALPTEAGTTSGTPQQNGTLLPTSEATQPEGTGQILSTDAEEPLASPDPSDPTEGDSEGAAEKETVEGAQNNTLWIAVILALGLGAIAGGVSLYRRKANRENP